MPWNTFRRTIGLSRKSATAAWSRAFAQPVISPERPNCWAGMRRLGSWARHVQIEAFGLRQMRNSTVSVVIPTRHRPVALLRALDSVMRQSYPATEIIVVIDGQDAETPEVLAGYRGDVKVVQLETPCGASAARNSGVRTATGEWIAFLDDDDEW